MFPEVPFTSTISTKNASLSNVLLTLLKLFLILSLLSHVTIIPCFPTCFSAVLPYFLFSYWLKSLPLNPLKALIKYSTPLNPLIFALFFNPFFCGLLLFTLFRSFYSFLSVLLPLIVFLFSVSFTLAFSASFSIPFFAKIP